MHILLRHLGGVVVSMHTGGGSVLNTIGLAYQQLSMTAVNDSRH